MGFVPEIVIRIKCPPQHNMITSVVCSRETKCSMDSLKFVCSWQDTVRGASLSIKIGGLQLEGCTFDGTQLAENQRDSPTVSSVPKCVVAWVSKVGSTSHSRMADWLILYTKLNIY